MRRIGLLVGSGGGENDSDLRARFAAFENALHELGWTKGRNVQIDYRFAQGNPENTRRHAVELVDLAPDIIVTAGAAAVPAVLQATRAIPIVFTNVPDPVEIGLVASMARPGGNMTGFSAFEVSIIGKLLEALKEIAPRTAQVGLMFHPDNTGSAFYLRSLETVAPSVAVKSIAIPARDPAEIERAIDALANEPNCALMLAQDVFMVSQRDLIVRLVSRHHLPTVYPYREYVVSGGLLSYGADALDRYLHRACAHSYLRSYAVAAG